MSKIMASKGQDGVVVDLLGGVGVLKACTMVVGVVQANSSSSRIDVIRQDEESFQWKLLVMVQLGFANVV